MDTEFHFYMTGIIAEAAGFSEEDARIIATASEYVDENDVCLTIEDRPSGELYQNYISQTMNILKPKRKLMRIYPVFHFVPGNPMSESACRCDGKMHLLNTTPGNETADKLFDLAFRSSEDTRLYRIGIATHAYADTWAHQNFVGWYDFFNDITLDAKPDIGHANAEHHPDWPAHRVGRLAPWLGDFDESDWFKAAIDTKVLGLKDADNGLLSIFTMLRDKLYWKEGTAKEKTHWYRFQEAVKEHQGYAMEDLDPLFARMGVDLHKV